jgi:hypothetical protein
VSSFQKVATFRIVGGQKQGGNVATYFCAPDGRVLHLIAGPVDAATMLREAKWVVDKAHQGMEEAKGDGAKFKSLFRKWHAEKLRQESGLVVEPVLFDPETQDDKSALTYRDPSGRPLAPILLPPPIDGPDVTFHLRQAEMAKAAGAVDVKDRAGRRWALGNQGRVDMLLAGHALVKIDKIYGTIFEGILGEKVTTRPVEIVTPFPWAEKKDALR